MLSICDLFKDYCWLLFIHSHLPSVLYFPVFMVLGSRKRRKVEEIKIVTNNLTDSELVTLLSRHLRSPGNHCPLICYWTSSVPALEDRVGICFHRRVQNKFRDLRVIHIHLDSQWGRFLLWGIVLFQVCFYFSPSTNIWALFWSNSERLSGPFSDNWPWFLGVFLGSLPSYWASAQAQLRTWTSTYIQAPFADHWHQTVT